MKMQNEDEARDYLEKIAFKSGLNRNDLYIHPQSDTNDNILDYVTIHFPIGRAAGNYAEIADALKSASSWDALKALCDARGLTQTDD